MAQIDAIKRLCERELRDGVTEQNSWHHKYRNSVYIFVGNFEKELSEGDLITAFSQFGEVIDMHLIRDDPGNSKGFCFLAYEDQRSTILAIDNMNGFHLYRRPLRVDHAPDFKPPKKYEEDSGYRMKYEPTGAEGRGLGVTAITHQNSFKDEDYDKEFKQEHFRIKKEK